MLCNEVLAISAIAVVNPEKLKWGQTGMGEGWIDTNAELWTRLYLALPVGENPPNKHWYRIGTHDETFLNVFEWIGAL